MEELIKSILLESHGLIAYATIFGVLLACGLGLPLPEDISLILGGYLAHHGAASLPVMMLVGFLGILGGDSLIFAAGRRIGTRVGQKEGGFFSRVVTPEKRAQVQGLFARHGPKVVMIARFLPGVRAVTYFTAGSAGMRYSRFILFDGMAALASAPVFVFLGWKFGDGLDLLIDKLKRGQTSELIAVAAVIVGYFVLKQWRKRQNERRAQALLDEAKMVEPAPALLSAADAASAPAPRDPGTTTVKKQAPVLTAPRPTTRAGL